MGTESRSELTKGMGRTKTYFEEIVETSLIRKTKGQCLWPERRTLKWSKQRGHELSKLEAMYWFREEVFIRIRLK